MHLYFFNLFVDWLKDVIDDNFIYEGPNWELAYQWGTRLIITLFVSDQDEVLVIWVLLEAFLYAVFCTLFFTSDQY